MLDNIKYATISKIYIKDLIFYDDKKEVELKKMCNDYGITYLPNQDRKSCYKLTEKGFNKQNLSEDLICHPHDRLFDESTLAKFENGNHDEVMFVVENGKIKGVVHIVDYNADFINFEFFKAIYQFEKNLRTLLQLNGETNDSLINWMREKGKTIEHWKKRYEQCYPNGSKEREEQINKRKDCSAFQTFFMNDLLYFIKSKRIVSNEFCKSIEAIKDIRNWVAHNKDLTHKNEVDNSPLYKIEELKQFIKNSNRFFNCYEELEEQIHLLKQKNNVNSKN